MDRNANRSLRCLTQAGKVLFLSAMLTCPLQGEQRVTLAWNPSLGTGVAGYRLYYGPASRQYTHSIDAGTATTNTVSGLEDGVTYFYAVTAYTGSGVESDLSNEVRSTPNRAPVLQSVPNQVARIDVPLVVTNVALDPDGTVQTLRFSLGPGAPTGATIDPVTGLFRWQPTLSQAGMAHSITIRVADNGSPVLMATTRFTAWVRNPLEIEMDSVSLRAGERGNLAVTVSTHLPLATLCLVVEYAPESLTEVALDSALPGLAGASLTPLTPGRSLLCVSSLSGQPLTGTQAVVRVGFTAVRGQTTALVPLNLSGVQAQDVDGHLLNAADLRAGRAIVVGDQLMLEAFQTTKGARGLLLYGPPPATASLDMATNDAGAPVWRKVADLPVTNLVQVITNLPPKTRFQLFRARKL